MKRSWRVLSAGAALGLVVVALIRLLALTFSPLFVLIIAVTPLLLLGSWLVILAGVLTRSRLLLGAGVALALLQVFWMLGEFGRSPTRIDAVEDAPAGTALRVATANVLAGNDAVGVLFESLVANGADVVMLQEITPAELDLLARTASWGDFPHRILDARPGAHGSVIVSRFAIDEGGVIWPGGWPMTRAVVRTAAGPVEFINVHVIAPLSPENLEIWAAQLADLRTQVAGAAAPVIIAGDFNATAQHAGVRAIVGEGVADAHLQAGWGWGATFPAEATVPALLRLDRILVSESLDVAGFERLAPFGSDHHPLLAEVHLPGA